MMFPAFPIKTCYLLWWIFDGPEVPTYSAGGRISSWTAEEKAQTTQDILEENDGKWWKMMENGQFHKFHNSRIAIFHHCDPHPTESTDEPRSTTERYCRKRLRLRHHPFLRLTPQAPIQTNTWFDLICKPTLTLWGELHQIGVCAKKGYNMIQYSQKWSNMAMLIRKMMKNHWNSRARHASMGISGS